MLTPICSQPSFFKLSEQARAGLGRIEIGDGRSFITSFALGIVAVLPTAEAQQSVTKSARLGYLSNQSAAGLNYLRQFRQGLVDLGYVEGQNIRAGEVIQ